MRITLAHLRALWHPVDLGAIAFVEQGGRVVLVRHSYKSGWMLPGGSVNRGEPPAEAILRELKEEIGLTHAATPQLFGLYTRRAGLATNAVALFRVREAVFVFKPGFEIREVRLVDPAAPPDDATPATKRRLKELIGEATQAAYW
ncbi:MAG TPA: NUDIX domain-containing protein [Rhizomicrobium sp.]|nr:NUDIX domain-containing protein [Rhizomicrobium sp.]